MIRSTVIALALCLLTKPLFAVDVTPKIFGGKNAEPEWHTLAALISISGKESSVSQNNPDPVYQAQFCGGTILSSQWILTAAHCMRTKVPTEGGGSVIRDNTSDVEVLVGSQSLDVSPNSTLILDVDSVYLHPSYNLDTLENDIALIKLSEPVPDISTTSPAVLSTAATDSALQNADSFDEALTALGWGAVAPSGGGYSFTLDLQEVGLDYLSNASCQSFYNTFPYLETILGTMLCAREATTSDPYGEDTCAGDSGGPIFMGVGTQNDRPQVGITSYGYVCGDPAKPGIYTRVSKFLPWIEGTAEANTAPLGDLSVASGQEVYQSDSAINFNLTLKNEGTEPRQNFRLEFTRSANLDVPIIQGTNFVSCLTSSQTTNCEYVGNALSQGQSISVPVYVDNISEGAEQLDVRVIPAGFADYHRLNNSLSLALNFGLPTLAISAEPICLNPGSSSVQMRVEATLANSSAQIYSEGTIVTGTLPEGLTLVGNASPSCTLEDDLFTCTVGQLNAGEEETTIVAVTAAPDTPPTPLEVKVYNDNGLAPGSTLFSSVELDFSREDLPTCPAIPAPVSNLTGGGSSGGGGGSTSLSLLGLLALLGLRRKR